VPTVVASFNKSILLLSKILTSCYSIIDAHSKHAAIEKFIFTNDPITAIGNTVDYRLCTHSL